MDLKRIWFAASILFFCFLPLEANCERNDDSSDKLVTFKGTSTLTGYISNRKGFGQDIPAQYLTWMFRGQLNVAGIPVNGSALLSTMQNPGYQPMNYFNLQFDTRTLLAAGIKKPAFKFLRLFETLEVGRTRPDYSKLMLSGIMLQGCNIGIRVGQFSASAVYGTSQQPVSNSFLWSQQYRQKMFFGRIGYGSREKSSIHISMLRYKDIEDSFTGETHLFVQRPDTFIHVADTFFIPGDTIPLIQHPGEGMVVGLQGVSNLFGGKFLISGEITGCANTTNTGSETFGTEALPNWVSSIYQSRLTTSLSYAARLNGLLNLQTTRIEATAMRVAPGYRSAGVPFMRQDYEGLEVQATQMLLKNRVTIQPWVRLYRDNLSKIKEMTTVTDIWGATAIWRPENLPWINVTYSPHRQEVSGENTLQQSRAEIITVATGKNYLLAKRYYAYTGLTWSGQNMTTTVSDITSEYKGAQLMLQQSLTLEMPLSLQLSGGYYSLRSDTTHQLSGVASAGAFYHHLNKWRAGLSIRYTGKKGQQRTGIAINFSADLGKAGRLLFVAEPLRYRDVLRPELEFNQYMVRCSLVTSI